MTEVLSLTVHPVIVLVPQLDIVPVVMEVVVDSNPDLILVPASSGIDTPVTGADEEVAKVPLVVTEAELWISTYGIKS